MLGRAQLTIGGDDRGGLLPRFLEDREVARKVGRAELGEARLPRAEELAVAAQLEVDLRDPKAVVGLGHRAHAAPRILAEPAAREQDAVRLPLAATDPAAQLVQLREAEALGVLDEHHARVR